MLRPEEFSLGSLRDAVGISLFLPLGSEVEAMIVARIGDRCTAVVLEGTHRYVGFDCTENENWNGVMIPNVALEVDQSSIIDVYRGSSPLGILTRTPESICIVGRGEGGSSARNFALIKGLPEGRSTYPAGFANWQIAIGDGANKRVLRKYEVAHP